MLCGKVLTKIIYESLFHKVDIFLNISCQQTDCSCECSNNNANMTQEELAGKLEELRRVLLVDKKETVRAKLKLVSAKDDRPTSKAIGSLGIIIITGMIVLILALDASNFPVYIDQVKGRWSKKYEKED